jgi:cell division protein FtsL
MNEAQAALFIEILMKVLQYGFFSLLGIIVATLANKRKSKAEIGKLEEETKKLNIENENLRAEQLNSFMKRNDDLEKAREELKGKLYIATEEKLLLSQELHLQRIESDKKQKINEELSARLSKVETLLNTQHKDIAEIKKQTGQLPAQLPDALEHKND